MSRGSSKKSCISLSSSRMLSGTPQASKGIWNFKNASTMYVQQSIQSTCRQHSYLSHPAVDPRNSDFTTFGFINKLQLSSMPRISLSQCHLQVVMLKASKFVIFRIWQCVLFAGCEDESELPCTLQPTMSGVRLPGDW